MKSGSVSRLAQAIGINSVPIAGVFLGEWSTATTLVVYWSETLLAALFTAARIAVHRGTTRKRGHYRDQWDKPAEHAPRRKEPRKHFKTFLSGFLVGSLSLTIGLGLFLALLLATVLEGTTDVNAIQRGVFWMAMAQLAGFGWDLTGIRTRPFAWVKEAADDVMGRVVLIHLGMLGGMFLLAWIGQAPAFFGTFAVMKLAADGIGLLARRDPDWTPSKEPPAWAAWLSSRANPRHDFDASWREHLERERARAEEDEEVMPAPDRGATSMGKRKA